jgi:hypothetical protein
MHNRYLKREKPLAFVHEIPKATKNVHQSGRSYFLPLF